MQSLITSGQGRDKPCFPGGAAAGDDHLSGARSTGRGGGGGTGDTYQALARLEAAVERLAISATRPPAPSGDGVSRAQVQAIADRLDETIARLRTALGEEG
jgi:hypothetical protein